MKQQWSHVHKRLNQQHPNKRIEQLHKQIDQLNVRNNRAFKQEYQSHQQRFTTVIDKLALLNPLNTMKRGYSVSYNSAGNVIQSTKQVEPGEKISVKLYNGTLDCQVWGIEEDTSE